MNRSYIIQWKSQVNGRAGRGTKTFEKAEAENLVEELNREYPQITHEVVEVQAGAGVPSETEEQPAPSSSIFPLLSIA